MSDNNAPHWKAVPALENYQTARTQSHRQIVRTEENKVKRVPALPYEYWCKPSGNVVRLVAMTTRNTRDAIEPQRYADFTRRRAIREGWFPWDYNDAQRYMPHLSMGMGIAAWEKFRAAEQAKRWNVHAGRSANYNSVWRTEDEHQAARTKDAMSEALTEMVKIMRDEKKTPQGGSR